jgi:pilus assembly protein CpaF
VSVDAEALHRIRTRLASETDTLDSAVFAAHVVTEGVVADATSLHRMRDELAAELHGAGPLEPLLADAAVTDVLVNGPDSVWVDRGRGVERVPVGFASEADVRRLARRLAGLCGVRLDDAQPFVDGVLADGTRLHAVLPPLVDATSISLRVLGRRRLDLAALVSSGALAHAAVQLLREVISNRLACLITGGAGTGKTTLLGALLSALPSDERIVVIEDAREVVVEHPHVVRLVSRAPNVEGAGGVGLRDLVRQALRMRPDRLVVGEFRGAEVVDLLVALNTGHDGGAATMHANSAADVPARLTALGALAGLPESAVVALAASALDVVVHLTRARDGTRRLAEIGVLVREGDRLRVEAVWRDVRDRKADVGVDRLRALASEYRDG